METDTLCVNKISITVETAEAGTRRAACCQSREREKRKNAEAEEGAGGAAHSIMTDKNIA